MKRLLLVALLFLATGSLSADEGMWTFDNFPRAVVQKKYGVQITDQWLNRVQRSVVRLETGCSASFVSPEGLVLTNHHCVSTCLTDNSTAENDLLASGFMAANRNAEIRCQGSQASVLVETQNVTAPVTAAMGAVAPAQAAATRNQTLTRLETDCEAAAKKSGTPLSCEAVTLYQGGQYWLYKYKRYEDVRLVFAPEHAIAAFGGDPDNFQFPRWCLDMSLLRVYDNGVPVKPANHLRINFAGPAAGDPVFVSGHPGTTQRLLTVAQLKQQRNLDLPQWLLRYSEIRGRYIQFAQGSEENDRIAADQINGVENAIKVRRKMLDALHDDSLMARKVAEQDALQANVARDASLKAN